MATAQKPSAVINGVAVDGLVATIKAVKATPSIAKFKFRIRNQWETGSRNRSTVSTFTGTNQELVHSNPFTLKADEPAVLLGKDLAANPVEHLLHALASCITTSMVYHASARSIRIDEVESSFEGDVDLPVDGEMVRGRPLRRQHGHAFAGNAGVRERSRDALARCAVPELRCLEQQPRVGHLA